MADQDQDLDPDVLNSIRNQNANPTSLWSYLTAPGLGLSKPQPLQPGQLPFSSKFGSVDEADAYNKAIAAKSAMQSPESDPSDSDSSASTPASSFSGPLAGAQAGIGVSQLPGAPQTSFASPSSPQGAAMGGKVASLGNGPVPGMQTLPADDSVKNAIAQKYGFGPGMDTAALQAAQQKQSENNLTANMGEAGNDIAAAFARGRGSNLQADNKFYQDLRAQAAQPAQNIAALRQSKLGDLAASNQFANNDPNSPVSKAVQDAYVKLGFPEASVRQLGAADLKEIQSPAELDAKLQSQKDLKQIQLAQIKATKELAQNEKDKGHLQMAQGRVFTDSVLNDAQKGLNEASSLDSQADLARTNPRANAMLPMAVVRTIVSRMNPQELQQATGGQDIEDVAKRMSQRMTDGTITKTDYAQLKEWIGAMRTAKQSAYDQRANQHISSYSSLSGQSPDASASLLGISPPKSQAQQQSSAFGMHAPGATVTVKGKQYVVGADGDTLTPAGGTFAAQ